MTSRRKFLDISGKGLIAATFLPGLSAFSFPKSSAPAWIKNLPLPKQSPLKFNIEDFGAIGDGKTMNTSSIQEAIDRCFVLGGGEVLIPKGTFLTGAVALKSAVSLHLDEGAVLQGSDSLGDYPISQVRWEGKWRQGHQALIYATDAENIGIKGAGKIQGSNKVGGRPNKENPHRRPALIEPINCKNIVFDGFSTSYHLMWCIHPTYCENVVCSNLNIRSTGGNGDGIDVDSCKNVLIENCDIATGDDCIAIKSGRGMEGYTLLRTTENVLVRNCTMADSIFACIGIGSETSGGIKNVSIQNCRFTHAKTHAIYIKSRPGRGAFIENIEVDGMDVEGMEGGFLRFNLMGSGLQDEDPVPGLDGIPTVKNFSFKNIRVKNVPILVEGFSVHPDKPLDGFVLQNVSGTCQKGIFLANVKNASIDNIQLSGFEGPLLSIHHVSGKGLEKAVEVAGPKVAEAIAAPDKPYVLK